MIVLSDQRINPAAIAAYSAVRTDEARTRILLTNGQVLYASESVEEVDALFRRAVAPVTFRRPEAP